MRKFESSVIYEGTKTAFSKVNSEIRFESSVIYEGTKTSACAAVKIA